VASTSGNGNGGAEHSGGEEERRKQIEWGGGSGMEWGQVPGGGAGEGSRQPATVGPTGGGRRSGSTAHVEDGTGEGTRGPVQRKENRSGPMEREEFLIYSKEF
jgi:hypothetical protein